MGNKPIHRSIPEGYDGLCANCNSPYTFGNAKGGKTEMWGCFCCRTCEAEARALAGGRVVTLPAGTLVHINGLPFRLRQAAQAHGTPANLHTALTDTQPSNKEAAAKSD